MQAITILRTAPIIGRQQQQIQHNYVDHFMQYTPNDYVRWHRSPTKYVMAGENAIVKLNKINLNPRGPYGPQKNNNIKFIHMSS